MRIFSHNMATNDSIQMMSLMYPADKQMTVINRDECMFVNNLHMKIPYEEMWLNQVIALLDGKTECVNLNAYFRTNECYKNVDDPI